MARARGWPRRAAARAAGPAAAAALGAAALLRASSAPLLRGTPAAWVPTLSVAARLKAFGAQAIEDPAWLPLQGDGPWGTLAAQEPAADAARVPRAQAGRGAVAAPAAAAEVPDALAPVWGLLAALAKGTTFEQSVPALLRASAPWLREGARPAAPEEAVQGPAGGGPPGAFAQRLGLEVHGGSAWRDGEGWWLPISAQLFRRNEGRHHRRLRLCRRLLEWFVGTSDFSPAELRRYQERLRLIFRNVEISETGYRGRGLEARPACGAVDAQGLGRLRRWRPLRNRTGQDGRSEAALWLSDEELRGCGQHGSGEAVLEVRLADERTDDGPLGALRVAVPLVEESGLSVVSDIDDTVKHTEVFRGHGPMLRNTFLEEFVPVPGMAQLYRRLASERPGTTFHYVSKSPPEFRGPLSEFLRRDGFPETSMHLCQLLGNDRATFKEARVRELLLQYPGRKFVLVGDSGELDAHVYATLARAHPDQVVKIAIRQVSPAHPVDPEVFRGVPPEVWQVFSDPDEVSLPPAPPGPLDAFLRPAEGLSGQAWRDAHEVLLSGLRPFVVPLDLSAAATELRRHMLAGAGRA